MSRHRAVRTMNYHDDYEGYDDVYGHSVEDDYSISPATAKQFIFDRSKGDSSLSAFMSENPEIPEEEEEFEEAGACADPLQDSSSFTRPSLSRENEGRLNQCLEAMRDVLGESTPEHVLVGAAINANYVPEVAINAILDPTSAPKEQRTPRKRADRSNRGEPSPAATSTPAVKITAAQSNQSANQTSTPQKPTNQNSSDAKPHTNGTSAVLTVISGGQQTSGFTPEPLGKTRTRQADGDVIKRNNSDSRLHVERLQQPELPPSSLSADASPRAARRDVAGRKSRDRAALREEYQRRQQDCKQYLNLVVIGHVDAGKSTLMGHLLFLLGFVNKRTMHKYEQDSRKQGKASFAYAWVLDETEEERSRGVTMDVGQTRFETENKTVTLLDAPGHKDFIPNMITGAAQADVAVLVLNATRGEFETGFEAGGQTREHAILVRSLGVTQLVVAVNKMDTVDWSQDRYDDVTKKVTTFLRTVGFREADLTCVPCSGLSGANLVQPAPEAAWYSGPTLARAIDGLRPPDRPIEKCFRLSVCDVFKGMGAGISVAGTVLGGAVQPGDRVVAAPQGEAAAVKSVAIDDVSQPYAFAGDSVVLVLTGIDQQNVGVGSIICEVSDVVRSTTRIRARIVIFSVDVPITKGFPVSLHYQSLNEPATIKRLVSQLHKNTGELVKKRPRCLVKNTHGVVDIETARPVCVELYKDFKDLGRFMLRYGGATIAAGVVTEILDTKRAANEQ